MRRLHARKGMALAMLPALLLAAGGCTKTPVAPVSREAAALTWTIVDEAGGVGRGDFTGKAVTAVFSALDTPPVITYLTGDQSLLVSRMLALDELPDLLTVPAGGALRSKIIGSGRRWRTACRRTSAARIRTIPASCFPCPAAIRRRGIAPWPPRGCMCGRNTRPCWETRPWTRQRSSRGRWRRLCA